MNDADLGSGGVLLLPDQSGVHPHLMVTGGKEGVVYLIDRDNLGGFQRCGSTCDNVVEVLPSGTVGGDILFGTPAYFNGRVYYQGCCRNVLKAFSLSNGLLSPAPVSQSSTALGYPGSTPSISGNGSTNGIVWTLQRTSGVTILHARDAMDLSSELYNSSQVLEDTLFDGAVKFTVPTIANGKVYVGTQSALSAFGLISLARLTSLSPGAATAGGAAFTLTVNGRNFGSDSVIRWNGSDRTTTFVTDSQLTAGIPASDIAIGGTAQVTVAESDGTVSNALTFTISTITCPSGQYFAEYYNNTSLNGTPTFTACESSVNYNWGMGGPENGLIDNFSGRWTGIFNFPSGTTTFTATANDGIRVWVDGGLIISAWADQSATTYKAFPTLTDGAHVVSVEYYDHTGDAVAQVSWQGSRASCPAGQYLAEYYSNKTLSGTPAFTVCEISINHDWGTSTPGNGVGPDNFSVRWTGSFTFAGTTTFTASADDGIRVWVDANQIINEWVNHPVTTYTAGVVLTAGAHAITVEYYEEWGDAVAQVSWQQAGTPTLSSLVPNSATAGGPSFTLTVNGSNFVSGAVVQWNGAARTTTFVNAARVTAAIPASDIATPGTIPVTVSNPTPGGGVSNAISFVINPSFTLTVTKSGNGTVTSTPPGIQCGSDCSEPYVSGSIVTLTATPGENITFLGWSGGGCSGTGVCTVTMDASKSVTATFRNR